MICKIVAEEGAKLPEYQTQQSAGSDVSAFLPSGSLLLKAGEAQLVPTGLKIEIPPGYEIQVRPRSGLAFKHQITVLNAPGTIDADYRGEVKILLINLGKNDFVINDGDRIAQFVFASVVNPEFIKVQELNSTLRAEGGFGSTGV